MANLGRTMCGWVLAAITIGCGGTPGGGGDDVGPEVDAGVVEPLPHDDWTTLGTGEGLPSNNVRDLAVAGSIVWVATEGGVAKIDGTTITAYRVADGLPSNDCLAIAVDPVSGRVWVGTSDAGLAVFDNGAWSAGPSVPWQKIAAVAVAPNGEIWVGPHDEQIVAILSNDGSSITMHDLGSGNGVRTISATLAGAIWVGTVYGFMVRDAQGAWTTYNGQTLSFTVTIVDSVFQAPDGSTWLGTWSEGMMRSGGTEWTVWDTHFDPMMPTSNIRDLTIDAGGFVWMTTQGAGLMRLMPDPPSPLTIAGKGMWAQYRTSNSPFPDINNTSSAIARTPDDALWIGTESAGVVRLL
jgi:ligand-binding sensor domain-containing protein